MAPPCHCSGSPPCSSVGVEHDHLIASGVLGGDAARLLERSFKEVNLFTLPRSSRDD
jgi:hypothetical protein